MPAEKVCEKLKKKDAQICDLRYGMKQLTFDHVDQQDYNEINPYLCRETNRSEQRGFEKVEGARSEEDSQRLGREL